MEKTVAWTAAHKLTRLGKFLLRRRKGVPMGSGILPEEANTALGECERLAYADSASAKRRRFSVAGWTPEDIARSRRLANDITLRSKVPCGDCLFQRTRTFYRGLKLEVAEKG